MTDHLHNHYNFNDLILILSNELSISPVLIVKDYWIMHCLYGLQNQGLNFQMKGGTSLSKGYNLIHRFSEDIDILIEPPKEISVHVGRNQNKDVHKDSRRFFYDWLAQNIKIDGIIKIERDTAFDDDKYRSGGIRLYYKTAHNHPKDLKEGVLLEVGFDDITPNFPKTISSWAYNYAEKKVNIRDNRAKNVPCYHPGYTLVEKLQTISTKFRKQQTQGTFSENFMRHYYDVYCLLKNSEILAQALGISTLFFNYLLMVQVSATCIGAFRSVGVLMVLAFITGPALTARLLTHDLGKMLMAASALGAAASIIGVALSRHLLSVHGIAVSTAGVVVCTITVIFFAVAILYTIKRRAVKA